MDIGIAGAGLMGRLLAWKLCTLGHNISLFDADLTGQKSAAYAAAGMLSPCTEAIISQEHIYDMGIKSMVLWDHIISQLDPTILFKTNGSIITCHTNDTPELSHFIQRLSHQTTLHALTKSDIEKLEPELLFSQGFLLPCEGFLDNRHLLKKLLEKTSAQCYNACVIQTKPHAIICKEHAYNFNHVFDCRGIGAGEHFPALRGVRGEVIRVHAPDVCLTHMVRLAHPRYPIYIVPREDHHYVIGATEIESNDTSPISVRSCMELLNAAYSIHRGFSEARIIETNTALRPTLPDNLPKIQAEKGITKVNGLYRHGFLIAPILLEQSIQILEEYYEQPHYH